MAESIPLRNGVAGEAPGATRRTLGQYVRDFSFENIAAQEGFAPAAEQRLSIQASVEAQGRGADHHYEVVIKLRVANKSQASGETLFLLELDYAGLFEVSGLTQEQLRPYLHVECPRMTFPFLRRIVAQVTQDAGFQPLILDTIDFASIYRKEEARSTRSA